MRVEWSTNANSCFSGGSHCQFVLQYFCDGANMKDGSPLDMNDAATDSTTLTTYTNSRFALHEPATQYSKCKTRERNKGLFASNQAINGNNAMFTRQNPNGQEYGFECQEERDYYPYWHPAPWRDIAIFTTNTSMCTWYKAESQNVQNKGECFGASSNYLPFTNAFDCYSNSGTWVESTHNIAAPECLHVDSLTSKSTTSATAIGDIMSYTWTIPYHIAETCVLRVRYNLSSSDYDPWTTDSKLNGAASPIAFHKRGDFGYSSWMSMAMNAEQHGRTFQDRSYVFAIRPRPTNNPELDASSTIWNLNVRGKRGNFLDVFPAAEYGFVPQNLELKPGDFVHIQWTGSDYNPNRNPNSGIGGPVDPANTNNYRADRSNMVEIDNLNSNLPKRAEQARLFLNRGGFVDTVLINKLAFIDQPISSITQCMSYEALMAANNNDEYQTFRDSRNCAKLNAAPTPYFDGGLIRIRNLGTYHYMCTRSNYFGNRLQKGTITVTTNGGTPEVTCFGKSATAVDVCSGRGNCTSLNTCTCHKNANGTLCENSSSTIPKQSLLFLACLIALLVCML